MELQTPAPKVISLIRVSTEEQAKGDKAGIPRQIESNRIGLQRHGLEMLREVTVIDVSGSNVLFDPQFQQIFEDLKRPDVAGVIVSEQSRLLRPMEFGDFALLDHFLKNKKFVFTMSEKLDPNSQHGFTALTVHAMMAGNELREIHKRFADGKEVERKKGRHMSGPTSLPRGVKFVRLRDPLTGKVVSEHWELDPIVAAMVRRAYELLFAGDSCAMIADELGFVDSSNAIIRMLKNPIWKGYREYTTRMAGEKYQPISRKTGLPGKFRCRVVRRDTPLLVKIDLPSVVSDEEWERAQEILSRRTKGNLRRRKSEDLFLLSGLAKCSCGRALYLNHAPINSRWGPGAYYCATNHKVNRKRWNVEPCEGSSIQATKLDTFLEEVLTKYLLDAELIAALLPKAAKMKAAADPAKAKREARLVEIKAESKRARDLAVKGLMPDDELKERVRSLELEARSLEKLAPVAAAEPLSAALIVKLLTAFFAGFANLPIAEKRNLLRRAVREITVGSRSVLSVTLNGGFVGMLQEKANHVRCSTTPNLISVVPDLTLHFPKPLVIPLKTTRPPTVAA